jgi:hypothetical protein
MKARHISVLAVCAIVAFTVAYTTSVQAWPTPYNTGYFTGAIDGDGTNVMPPDSDTPGCPGGGGNAIPSWIDRSAEFIAYVRCKLTSTNDYAPYRARERTGAAFLIQTMIGNTGSKITSLSDSRVAEWEARVRFYAAMGWINWSTSYVHSHNSLYQGSNTSASPNDDAFFDDNGSAISIVFRGGGREYAIRRQCVNPLGATALLDNPTFNMSGDSNVSAPGIPAGKNIQVTPGTVLTWTHTLTASGATSPGSIDWTTHSQSGVQYNSGDAGTFANGQTKTANTYTFTAPSTIGSVHCRYIRWTPDTNNGGTGTGPQACATIIEDYDLNPTVAVNQSSAGEGDTVTFTYRVENSGDSDSPPAQCIPQDGAGATIGGVALTCSASQSFPGDSGIVSVGTENIVIAGQPAGTRICRQLVIQPAANGVASRTSTLTCVVVAKFPYVHFMGGDVWAGGGFATHTPACNTNAKITTSGQALGGTSPTEFAGSVVEYQAFALNSVRGFGSSSHPLVDLGGFTSAGRRLTYANSDPINLSHLGSYGAAAHCMQDYVALLNSSATPLPGGSPITINVGTQPSGVYRTGSELHLHGTMPAGSRQVYISNSNIFIDSDIRYPDNYADVGQIPSLTVIGNNSNVVVMNNVSRIDGLYVAQGNGVARGIFRTCWPKTNPQAAGDICDQRQLVVNGAVVAGQIDLWRSYGSEGATVAERRNAAEVFNFNPEMYLRNSLDAGQTTIQTTNLLELPPRF